MPRSVFNFINGRKRFPVNIWKHFKNTDFVKHLRATASEGRVKKNGPNSFNNVNTLRTFGGVACNFIEKRLHHRCFPVKIAKFLRASTWNMELCSEKHLQTAASIAYQNVLHSDLVSENTEKQHTEEYRTLSGQWYNSRCLINQVQQWKHQKNL